MVHISDYVNVRIESVVRISPIMRRAADGITLEDELEEGSLAGGRREEGEDTPRGVRLAVGGVNDAERVAAAPLLRTDNTVTDRTPRRTGHRDGQDTVTDRTP